MSIRNTRFYLPLFVLLAIPAVSIAQKAPVATVPMQPAAAGQKGTYTLKVNSQLVVLDVVVTDKKGNLVRGLNKDDFEVYEDKQPQRIKSFERPQTHVLPSNQPITSTAQLDKLAPQSPVSIIVLDELNTRFEDEAFARYSLKKYLATQTDMLPQPTMLVAVDLQNFMVLHDYTTSKKDILSALDHHLARYPWHLTNGGGSWQGEMFNTAFNALMQVAEATEGHPGHKNMIWIGRGFPSVDLTSLDPDDQVSLTDAIQTCTNMLRDARVTLYTVDPAGISSTVSTNDPGGYLGDDPFGGEVSFNTMATATGGHAFYGRNDVDNLIGNSVRDGINFYTLSYVPNTDTQDPKAFRDIKIEMKDPSLKAVAREGYYPAAPPPPPMLDGKPSARLIFDLSMAAQSMMVYDSVPLTVTRDPANPDNFTIHVDEKAIDWKNNGTQPRTADISVVVASFDRRGKLLGRNAQNLTATAPALPSGSGPEPRAVNIHTTMKSEPPAARMRFIVRVSATGKVGAENIYLVDQSKLVSPTSYFPKKNRDALGRRRPR